MKRREFIILLGGMLLAGGGAGGGHWGADDPTADTLGDGRGSEQED